MRLSVLDQSPVSEGSTGAQALRNSIDLAQYAEALGYERYWVAEHHGGPAVACASPEPLIGSIGAVTSRMRAGSGGVMLPHYSPLRVAESFSMLSGLYPGRVDLAVGRSAGTIDPALVFALQRDRRQAAPDDFPAQLAELIGYLDDDMPADHPFAHLTQLPGRPELPDLWLLGSSAQSGIWAAELGLPYAFADFINPGGAEIMARYRQHFTPAKQRTAPKTIVAVWAICADTDDEARRLAASAAMMFTLLLRRQLIAIPPVEKALRFLEQDAQSLGATPDRRRTIVGSPATVRAGIESVARDYAADEVMVVTITYDHAARKRSYELIADAFRK